ncbi:MAG: gliding motility-associated C-terminal domain-containing protein [Candidatus Cyclobacteriaceae bacterium M2_1C_046]
MKYLKTRTAYILLLLFAGYHYGHAQHPSENGQFEVNVVQGCADLYVEITNPCANCQDYDFNNDGISDGINFTYTTPGTYTIEATAAGQGVIDQLDITVHRDTIPQFNIYRCGNRSVEVLIDDDNYDSYNIAWGDGNSTTVSGSDKQELYTYASGGTKTITLTGLYDKGYGVGAGSCTPNSKIVNDVENLPVASITEVGPIDNQTDKVYIKYTANPNALYRLQLSVNGTNNFIPAQIITPEEDSIVVSSLLLENNYYCFRIATLNVCAGGNPPEAFSETVCTQVFNVNFTGDEENILNWSTSSTGISGYTIKRNSDVLGPFNDPSRRNLTDIDVTCNEDYCYTLVSNYISGAKAISLQKCGTTRLITTPPAVDNIVTQVNDDQINIFWQAPANTVVDFYNLFRSVNNAPFDVAANELIAPEFSDNGLAPASNPYCYQINYKDRCNNTSEMSKKVCALRLTGGTSTLQIIELKWNAYNGYSAGVSGYLIEKFNANGSLLESLTITGTTYTDDLDINAPQELHYRVTAIPNDGSFENSVSNFLKVIRPANFTAPNAFIPGSGGENSVFKIISPFIAQIDLRIYNRWGQIIYRTTDPNLGWPGTDQNGNLLPQGTYIYQAQLVSEAGEESQISGSVLLIRK